MRLSTTTLRMLVMFTCAMVLLFSTASGQEASRNVTVAIGSDITTLDPHLTTDTDSASVRYHLYEGLVHTDGSGQPTPQLAESWTVSEDGLTYTFTLRQGVTFHDGATFDAAAVKENFDRLLHPERESSAKDYMSMIAGTEVIDTYTVSLQLHEPFAPFLNHMGVHAGHIVSPRAAAEFGLQLENQPAGTGPFRFVERVRGERIVLEGWDEYWGESTEIERLVFQVVPEAGARIAMLETGEADVILRVTPDDVPRLGSAAGVDVVTIPTARTMYIVLNLEEAPFDDVRIRRAANYAVDKEAIIEHILGGGTQVVDAPIAPAIFGYSSAMAYPYDPERARGLLSDAGNPNPTVVMWAPQARFPQGVQVVQVIQQQLQEVGFNVELQVWGDYPAYLDTFSTQMRGHDAKLMGWAASSLDAEAGLRQPLHGERAGLFINTGGYDNPQVNELMDAARVSIDRDERLELYARLGEIVMEDAPWIFLYYGTVSYGQRAHITGVDYRPSEHVLFHNVEFVGGN